MAQNAVRRGVPRTLDSRNSVRVTSASAIPKIQYSTGMANALRGFSRDMFRLSSSIENQLDDQAEAEAQNEGAIDGATGNLELRDYATIRGRAYNQAGIQTFVATTETRAIEEFARLQIRHANDPAGLQTAMDEYINSAAQEISRVSPQAGIMFRNRQKVRSIPAVEQAMDNHFKLTRDQADAAIASNELALTAELNVVAKDLFSENPARSQAAAQSIGALQEQLAGIYGARDPVTGRPLYSEKEKAIAFNKFYTRVFEQGTLSWFDSQQDPIDAYMRFTEGEFEFTLESSPASVPFIDETGQKIRNLPITDTVRNQIATAAAATSPELQVAIVSGGQNPLGVGTPRTGSTRHDAGNAADVTLVLDGKKITPDSHPEIYERFLENAAAAGATGIGHYSWGVHIGGGKRAAWGPNTRSNTLDPTFGAAIERGWSNPIDAQGTNRTMDLRKVLSPTALAGLEAEMRQRISFRNTLEDRKERQLESAAEERQDIGRMQLFDQLYSGGQTDERTGEQIPFLTRETVLNAKDEGRINAKQAVDLLRAMNTEKPTASDQRVLRELWEDLYNGEDIYDRVIEAASKLSSGDAKDLMARNHSLNVQGEGTLSKEEQFQLGQLDDLLTPDSLMADIDPNAEFRKYLALDEARRRIQDGEIARDVVADLAERATRDIDLITGTALDKLPFPRFAVMDPAKPGNIDIKATGKALAQKLKDGEISKQGYNRQSQLLRRWFDINERLKPNDKAR